MQIRNKLTIQFLFIVAGMMLAALFYIHIQFRQHLENEFYNNLHSKAGMTAEMVLGKTDTTGEFRPPLPGNTTSYMSSYSENIAIYDQNNQRIYSFNPVANTISPDILKEIRKKREFRFRDHKFCALGIVYNGHSGLSYVVVAESVFTPEHLDRLTQILVWVFCIMVACVTIGGWIFAGQALAPVRRIMNQVDTILPTDLSQRLDPPNQKDELSRLVITFNKLLDRIQQVFKNQKMFLSNISHELRNPLNVIISHLEIMLDKDRTNQEYKQSMVLLLEDIKELNEVSEKLTQLAKINADGMNVSFERLRIEELIWQSKHTLLKSHQDYNVCFEVASLPEDENKLYVNGNEQLLKTALLNLMDNGCKYSPDKHVKVRLSYAGHGPVAIEIQDKGPGITQDELTLVFEPFYRSPKTASVKGSGIGLSLVESILKLHQINFQVSSLQGTGTVIKLEFPEIMN